MGEFGGGVEGLSWLFVGDVGDGVSGVGYGGCWDGNRDFLAAGCRDWSGCGGVGSEGLTFSLADGVGQVVAYVVLLAEFDDLLVDFL